MALEATFKNLCMQFRKLHDALDELRLTIEDKPARNDAAVADHLEDAVLELMGVIAEGSKAAREACRSLGHPADLDLARRALTSCHEQFTKIEEQFAAGLGSYDKLEDLIQLGNDRRGEWQGWVCSIRQGISQCRQPIQHTNKALAACWQEIAERVGTTSISLQSSNVGQKIVTRDLAISKASHEVT